MTVALVLRPLRDDEFAAFLSFAKVGYVRHRSLAYEEVAVTMGKDLG